MLLRSDKKIEALLLEMPLVAPFETSFGSVSVRTVFLVRVADGEHEGWGEVVAEKEPDYSYETTRTALHVLKNYLADMALKAGLDPQEFEDKARSIKGHNMAKAGLSLALWDLKARKQGVPLSRLYGGVKDEIASGISIGIQKDYGTLREKVAKAVEEGYVRVKVKIKPGWDVEIVKRLREDFPQIPLSVDANSAYTEADFEHLKKLDEFSLLMIEQPLYEDDLYFHSRLRQVLKTRICLDESLTSFRKVVEGYHIGSYDIVNVKVGRMGGPGQVLKTAAFAEEKGIPLWCGGMLESGVGRLHNIHLASLRPFVLPNDISISRRYFHEDILVQPVEFSRPGYIKVPEGDGIGVEVDLRRVEKFRVYSERLT